MKEVIYTEDKDGRRKRVTTPWLTTDEAAAYCGISRGTFELHSKGVPHGGSRKHRRYHREMLDRWINNELSVPFGAAVTENPEASVNLLKQRRPTEPLMDPVTGKVFGR